MYYIGHMYVTLECESLHFGLGRGGLMWSAKIHRTPYPRGAGAPCCPHGGGVMKPPRSATFVRLPRNCLYISVRPSLLLSSLYKYKARTHEDVRAGEPKPYSITPYRSLCSGPGSGTMGGVVCLDSRDARFASEVSCRDHMLCASLSCESLFLLLWRVSE